MSRNSTERLWRNRVSMAGAALSLLALLFILSLLFFDLLSPQPNPYLGVFTFLVGPAFLVVGVGLVGLGFLLARRRVKRIHGSLGRVEYYPRIDLNSPSHRRGLLLIAAGVATSVPFIGMMSYRGYEYTDSNEFCGQVCHTVMEPEYTAHKAAAHARVECAACHIGPGASWYVKSKMSGLRQVIAVATDRFDRPIPPAIHELRPARETCEQCHWPEKFFGDQLVTVHRFASDEHSTPRAIRMFVKTGGSDPMEGPPSGIHWHMAIERRIEFVATDPGLQQIPWIRSVDAQTGHQVIYRSDGLAASDPVPRGRRREMDCIDCHNRSTHVFRPPAESVDLALNANPELRSLPFAKRELTAAVVRGTALAAELRTFYDTSYPEVARTRSAELERLIAAGQQIVSRSYFPSMKVDWRTYPDNVGHKNFPGCFRCHDGRHVDDQGNAISRSCAGCHEFLAANHGADEVILARGQEFEHPVPLEGAHATMRCDGCHTGGVAPQTTCAGCHADTASYRAGALELLETFGVHAEPMNDVLECTDCHDLSKPTDAPTLQVVCSDCHDGAPYESMVADWNAKARSLLNQAEAGASPAQRRIIDAIRRAGPLHNMDATVKVLTALARSR